MSIYISGPMTGYPDFNRAEFHHAESWLTDLADETIINPAAVDLGADATWADYMRHHLATIASEVHQVVTLNGWESSRGARLEVHVALELGIPVLPLGVLLNALTDAFIEAAKS